MSLQFLEFDTCEDADGLLSWDAVASPSPRHNLAMLSEVRGVLARLQQALGPAGPLDEGHVWDVDLQIHDDDLQSVALEAAEPPAQRITLALSLSGGDALADALNGLSQD